MGVLSERNPSGSYLFSTSYFSFLSCYGYMVITIPIHFNVYNCVCVCVCVCVGFALLMFQSVTPSLRTTFSLHCSWIIAFIWYICCVTVTPVCVCVCVCTCLRVYVSVCVHVCVWVDVFVLHSWCFRVSFFCIVSDMVGHFWPKTTSDYFFCPQ